MATTEEQVFEDLKQVIDPELFVNIVDLGLIYSVDLTPAEDEQLNVKVDMTLTSPMCPAGPQLVGGVKHVLESRKDISEVEVQIVMEPQWSPDRMTDDARDQLGIF